MNTTDFKAEKLTENVLHCSVKDDSGLNDFQKLPDKQGISIPRVGIGRFRCPIEFRHQDGRVLSHDCEASMFVNLPKGKTGINMSRLCQILQEESSNSAIDSEILNKILTRYRYDLRDSGKDLPFEKSFLKLKLNYPLRQKSLKSGNWDWQYYPIIIEAHQNNDGEFGLYLTIEYEYSSTCPCSLSMR